MIRIARTFIPLIAAAVLAACQSTSAPSASETPEPTPATSAAASVSARPSVAASPSADPSPSEAGAQPGEPAEPVDRAVLETALTAAGCEFVNEFNHGPVWGCPGADGSYVVSLLTDATGQISDVLISPDFDSAKPSEEVADLAVGILEVIAPSAASAELDSVSDAIASFDRSGEPTELIVAGWTVYLAPGEGTLGDSWSLGISASS